MKTNENAAAKPFHPGKALEKLIGKGANLRGASYWLAVSEVELALFIAGDIPLTAGLALRLSRIFEGRTAHEWMKLQVDLDLFHAEENLRTSLLFNGARNLNYLRKKEDLSTQGNTKMTKEQRTLWMTHLVNSIETEVNNQRNAKGESPWLSSDFENAFKLGTATHPGRQWNRWKGGEEGVNTDKLHDIKNKAERNGWYGYQFSHNDLVPDFLAACEFGFLRLNLYRASCSLEVLKKIINLLKYNCLEKNGYSDVEDEDGEEVENDDFQEWMLASIEKLQLLLSTTRPKNI